jgi:hypothetical protein
MLRISGVLSIGLLLINSMLKVKLNEVIYKITNISPQGQMSDIHR